MTAKEVATQVGTWPIHSAPSTARIVSCLRQLRRFGLVDGGYGAFDDTASTFWLTSRGATRAEAFLARGRFHDLR